MKAAVYVRISRDKEGRELGIKRQEQDCRALAKRLKWDVVGVYSDNDLIATSPRRKGWQTLLKALESGDVKAVLAYSSSRMYRRVADLTPLIEHRGCIGAWPT